MMSFVGGDFSSTSDSDSIESSSSSSSSSSDSTDCGGWQKTSNGVQHFEWLTEREWLLGMISLSIAEKKAAAAKVSTRKLSAEELMRSTAGRPQPLCALQ